MTMTEADKEATRFWKQWLQKILSKRIGMLEKVTRKPETIVIHGGTANGQTNLTFNKLNKDQKYLISVNITINGNKFALEIDQNHYPSMDDADRQYKEFDLTHPNSLQDIERCLNSILQ